MKMQNATALFHNADPIGLLEAVGADLAAQDVAFERTTGPTLCYDTGIGAMRLGCDASALRIEIESDTAGNLHMLREGLCARLDRLLGAPVELMWSGLAPRASGLPPSMRIARVLGRSLVGKNFLRLRLAAERLEDFARSGLHIRLLIPPPGRAPTWPRVGANGRTIWPDGDDALHIPAYTIRAVDPAAGWLDVDIFLHGNGATCRWAQEVAPGEKVGISGPGGGWLPPGDRWVLAGDETALPAMARMLELAPVGITGQALIEVADAQSEIALASPPGFTIRWLHRATAAQDLVTAFRSLPLPAGEGAYVWFAAEKSQAAAVRQYLRSRPDIGKSQRHVAGYWCESIY
ncbi:siderophore-interacting protein [Sulfitobacter aestuarii]|uniref:Siderophore-interacting protein n=1 Tax=Sulfitobacter aestuarii TaxID=2161676 RepID=A0ABW5U7X6_9RHOB